MNIVFVGTALHHLLTATNIYLDKAEDDYFTEKFLSYHKSDSSNNPVYIACDLNGNNVFILETGPYINMVEKSISQLVEIMGFSARDILVKRISIKGERLLIFINKLACIKGGQELSLLLTNYIIRKQYSGLVSQIEDLKKEIVVLEA